LSQIITANGFICVDNWIGLAAEDKRGKNSRQSPICGIVEEETPSCPTT
jgi:hypothetical protein